MKVISIQRSIGKQYLFPGIVWLLVFTICRAQTEGQILQIKHAPQTNTFKSANPLYGEFYQLEETFNWGLDGTKETTPTLTVELERAAAAVLLLEGLELPIGTYLEIRDGRGVHHIFDARHVSEKGILNTGLLAGKRILIQWFSQGKSETNRPQISLKKMVLLNRQDYELLKPADASKDFGASDNCNININCAQGAGIQNEKRGVARILLVVEEGMGWCSGSLINNSDEDLRPFFLTAFHCQDGFTPLFDFWRFDFNYEYENCSGGLDEPLADAVTGCEFRVGRQSSDFMLLELQTPVPYSYRPYWNGWNRSNQVSSSLIMAHHPMGDIKKVTRFDDELIIRSFPRDIMWTNNVTTPANHHWEAPHTSGMFEVGSSGAPAFDPQGRIVGQLHGGVPECISGVGYFGKLHRSWEDVQADGQGLFRYLSPGEPNKMSLSGLDAPRSYCQGVRTFEQSSGTITDGSETDVYLPGTNCSFLIQLPNEDNQVRLEAVQLDLGAGDTLLIYDGANSSAGLLDVWTQNTASNAEVLADGHQMFLVFEVDDLSERQGFELQYSSEDIGLDLQISLLSKSTERAVVYLYDEQFLLLDSSEYDASQPGSFESLFEIEENSGRYYLSASVCNPDWREGVSTLDLLRMETLFRQDEPFINLYEFLSADVDENLEVNLADLIYMARFVRRLENDWPAQNCVQLYNPEILEDCENANWMDCMRYNPVRYVEINSGNPSPTGALQIQFQRLQKGDLNQSARF